MTHAEERAELIKVIVSTQPENVQAEAQANLEKFTEDELRDLLFDSSHEIYERLKEEAQFEGGGNLIQSYNAGTRTITFRAFKKHGHTVEQVPSVTITLPSDFFKWAASDLRMCVQLFVVGYGESMAQVNVASKWLLYVTNKYPKAIYQLEMLVYALATDKCMYSDEIEEYLRLCGHWQAPEPTPKPAPTRSWLQRIQRIMRRKRLHESQHTGALALQPGHNSLRAGHRTWDFA